jgi:hypothetical protein
MENTQENFEPALAAFVEHCQKVSDDYMIANFPNNPRPTIKIQRGSRYVRLVRCDHGSETGSAHCFVDTTNGDVLKAASFKQPAKGARGNIYTPENYGVYPFGAKYLKKR